eukprot:TRINITY_DN1470_c0_g1_i3.p1 TRINITY_DN1470_c0_g1~~TRINITY_DN1470_c0_g1_i3.p1  ORF type:complete len:257 (+),score=33.23 TRINITY_DN1470_c0_g1_i3:152-922(+)
MFGQLGLDSFLLGSDAALLAAFATICQKLRSSKSSAGLSLQSLAAFVGARCVHLGSYALGMHYTPVSLHWGLFALFDVCSAVVGIGCVIFLAKNCYHSYEAEKDSFGIKALEKFVCLPADMQRYRPQIAIAFLYTLVALISLVWYCFRQSNSFVSGFFCCFYESLSGVALIPQLWMFQQEKRVPPIMAAFILFVVLSRLCTLSFWICFPFVHLWIKPTNRSFQMAIEVVNLCILSDFIYYWAKAKIRGEKDVVLPS